jgi:two-component system, sensor histidine kinase PdtaS
MADCAPVLVWMSEPDGECSFFNRGWLVFTGRTMEEEIGVGWAGGIHAEDFQAAMHLYLDSFVARREFRTEYRLRRHDGKYRWILDHGVPRYAPDGGFAGYIGSCIDITDMREAHAALSRVLDEREVLLKEIHHRVKNNLQILSSLHRLQSRRVTDAGAREVLRDNDARVRSIALVHDMLHHSSTFSTIALQQYAGDIATTIRKVSGRSDVGIEVDADGVGLGIDLAIPCGLIINELVTNAIKHAFPEDRAGKVVIRATPVAAGADAGTSRVKLVVSDDGIGLPPGWDAPRDRRSLGLALVTTLAKQLDATIDVGSGPGTSFALTFDTGRDLPGSQP